MPLTRLLYCSTRRDHARESLDAILRVAEVNNQANAISGVLVAGEEHFLQLLEGRRADVMRLFTRILRDARHHDVQIVAAGDLRTRLFQGWSMRRVLVSEVRGDVLHGALVEVLFQPHRVSEEQLLGLCARLASDDWRAVPTVGAPWSSRAAR